MNKRAFVLGLVVLLVGVAAWADTIRLQDGNIVVGQITGGIPEKINMVKTTGEVITLDRSQLKQLIVVQTSPKPRYQIDTWSGESYTGEMTNLAQIITVQAVGEVRTIPVSNIVSITFSSQPTPVVSPEPPVVPGSFLGCENLVEQYEMANWNFYLGLGYTIVGVMQRNGFGYPRHSIGVSVTLGLQWRFFFSPGVAEVERALERRCSEACVGTELSKAVQSAVSCLAFNRFLYIQFGVDFLMLPSIGIGGLIAIGPGAFFDLGIVVNPFLPWFPLPIPYIGVMLIL